MIPGRPYDASVLTPFAPIVSRVGYLQALCTECESVRNDCEPERVSICNDREPKNGLVCKPLQVVRKRWQKFRPDLLDEIALILHPVTHIDEFRFNRRNAHSRGKLFYPYNAIYQARFDLRPRGVILARLFDLSLEAK